MGDLVIWNGFNEHAGWAHTVQYSDQADLYKLRFDDPKRPLAFRYGNGYRMAEEREVKVKYKTDAGIREKTFRILFTSLGPVVGTVDGIPVALKDSFDITHYFIENWDINKVKNYKEFHHLISLCAERPNTFAYADGDGTIAFWHSNAIPRRNAFYDWSLPIEEPGPDAEWQGIHTPEETPHVVNPKSGYFENCNSDPWILSGRSSPDSLRYPAYMSYDPRSLRSVRADRLLNNNKKFSFADFEKVTLRDFYLLRFEILFPSLFALYDHTTNASLRTSLAGPIAVLKKWNFYADTNSVATTLAIMLEERLSKLYGRKLHPFNTAKERYAYEYTKATDFPGDTALLFLKDAVDELQKDFGTWEVAWGRVNRLQRISPLGPHKEFDDSRPSYAVIAGPNPAGSIFDYQSFRTKNTKLRYGVKGNTFVAVIDFGPRVKARTILANGESADPSSPHYTDQARLYATGQMKDAYLYKEEVLKHVEARYHPGNLKK
jgi:acyl-homoserine lactone acylase PvdQ